MGNYFLKSSFKFNVGAEFVSHMTREQKNDEVDYNQALLNKISNQGTSCDNWKFRCNYFDSSEHRWSGILEKRSWVLYFICFENITCNDFVMLFIGLMTQTRNKTGCLPIMFTVGARDNVVDQGTGQCQIKAYFRNTVLTFQHWKSFSSHI